VMYDVRAQRLWAGSTACTGRREPGLVNMAAAEEEAATGTM
jgi:hypothetical protein